MMNVLAFNRLKLKTEKAAGKKPERETWLAKPLHIGYVDPKEDLIKLINHRFKRPYAKKGWWWSGLYDPTAKNRRMIESIEILFERMSKKTYEEKHTSEKREDEPHQFAIHSQNIDIEMSIQHITHTADGDLSKKSSNKNNKKTAWQDNVIDLVMHKQQKTSENNSESISAQMNVPNEQVEEYRIKIKTVRASQETFVPKAKDPEVECTTTLNCTASEVAQIIASVISKTAKQSEPNSEKPVEISIGNGIVPNLVEIFIDNYESPLVANSQINGPIPVENQNGQQTIKSQSYCPKNQCDDYKTADNETSTPQFVNELPTQNAVPQVQQPTMQTQNSPAQNTRDPEVEELQVTTPTTGQTNTNNILFFPAQPQNKVEINEINLEPATAPKIETQENEADRSVTFSPAGEKADASCIDNSHIVNSQIVFAAQPSIPVTAPLAETIMADFSPSQKIAENAPAEKNGDITVFFEKAPTSAMLKQTNAEAAPDE